MASACVNNIRMSPGKFPAAGYPSCGWMSPRASLTREDERPSPKKQSPAEGSPENQDPVEFEFRLEDPVAMLSADELFSDGKLVPLKFTGTTMPEKPQTAAAAESSTSRRRLEMEISSVDPYVFSPKVPRCTTRWRELLGLKRLAKTQEPKTTPFSSSSSSSSSPNPKTSPLKHFIHRSSKSSMAPSVNHPLLMKDSNIISESLSISCSRLSLSSSSSSSGHELDDLPRLSLDLDKNPSPNPFAPARPRMRPAKPRRRLPAAAAASAEEEEGPGGVTVTVDSPRLNASGKLVFHGLERSSSSPGSFNGGPRPKHHHGMPRSYSANVRITPVLNVPVCSLRGSSKSGLFFGQLFSSSSSSSSVSSTVNRGPKNRTNRARTKPVEPGSDRTNLSR